MESEPTQIPAANESTFEVSYESGRAYNRDLAGRGSLIVRPEGVLFRGRQRRLLRPGPPIELWVPASDIRNVSQGGFVVEFATSTGRSGKARQPFIVCAPTEEDAARIAALLPQDKDPEFRAAEAFVARLQQLTATETLRRSITFWIIVANVTVYLVMGLFGAGWFETASMRPYQLFAANNAAATPHGEWWRLLTAMFSHYGLLHLFFNMWALLQTGDLVERLLGRRLFAIMYLGSGIIGGLASLSWHGDKVWSAGASGAVFGVFGAMVGYLVREKHGMPRPIWQPLLKSSLLFAGYNLFIGAAHPHIDNVAHLAGLLAGFVFGWMSAMNLDPDYRSRETPRRVALSLLILVVLVGAGVLYTPRAPYTFRDLLRWEELARRFDATSATITAHGEDAFQRAGDDEEPLRAWLRSEAIPHYDAWRESLRRVPLRPGLVHDRARNQFVRVLELKTANLRALLQAIDGANPNAIPEYEEREKQVFAASQQYRAMLSAKEPAR